MMWTGLMWTRLRAEGFEMWDITWPHLQALIPVKIKALKDYQRHHNFYYPKHSKSFQRKRIKRMELEILFLKRELKRRTDYPEYRKYCEMYVVGMNVKQWDHINSYRVVSVRNDPGFLMSFAMWCEDHGMMVQSRKLMRIIERMKYSKVITITKEDICNDSTGLIYKVSKNVGQK